MLLQRKHRTNLFQLPDSVSLRLLSRGLVVFLRNGTVFSIKRLLPADLKELYLGPGGDMGGRRTLSLVKSWLLTRKSRSKDD